MHIIMKAKYQKPTIKDAEFSLEAIMITGSNGSEKFIEDGGGTSTGGITSGDSRAWSWDDDDDY